MILHIQDDFLTPEELERTRRDVLKEDFAGVDYEGHHYSGITVPDKMPFDVLPKLDRLWNREVGVEQEFFRLSKPNEATTANIHADTICAQMASVLYLTPSDIGGTAFWKHKETKLQALPKTPSDNLIKTLQDDANDESKWDMQAELKFKLNRLVTYPTKYFHSRWPFLSDGFGDSVETGRLIYVCFYNL